MYLIPIAVPIFKEPSDLKITTDWKRALELLRDSLEGRYGSIAVVAPWRRAQESEHVLENATLANDDIQLIPAFDFNKRLSSYWFGSHQQAMTAVVQLLPKVKVVHGTVVDPMRAFCYTAFMKAARTDIPSVFVQDQDEASAIRDLHKNDGFGQRCKAELYATLHEQQCRSALALANLSLLKGRRTVKRYSSFANQVLQIENTSYFSHEIISSNVVQARILSLLSTPRSLRFGFCGRLVDIKGVARSLRIIHKVKAQGVNVAFDIIGSGPEEEVLKNLSVQLGLSDQVTFVGAFDYGPKMLQRLAECDALLFNPQMEETPRMIFDGYAAGLPLVADGIDYVLERSDEDAAVIVLPRDNDAAAVKRIVELDRKRTSLKLLTERAMVAALHHAADNWYSRRAEATHEMVDRYRFERNQPHQE